MFSGVISNLRLEYRNQLGVLKSQIIEIADFVSDVFGQTIEVVQNNNISLAKKISESDAEVDQMGRNIEDNCLRIVSLQSPFASDLRMVTGYIKIVNDFERIADQCAEVCEIVSMGNLSKKCVVCSNKAVSILEEAFRVYKRTCDACFSLDAKEAKLIFLDDDKIDLMFSDIIFYISNSISKDSSIVSSAADLMFISKYAERMADHCVNISKWIIYINRGFFPDKKYFIQ